MQLKANGLSHIGLRVTDVARAKHALLTLSDANW